MKAPTYVANFDSAAGMLRALSRFLHGKDYPLLGQRSPLITRALQPVGAAINALPRSLREQVYIWSGWSEAIAPRTLAKVRAEDLARWVVAQYPPRQYPAVVIGSASGALIHLCAALGIPWLPQTVLIPVARSGIHPDEPLRDMAWGKRHAGLLLAANPELQLHHMNDANQDRLMIQRMTYFRVKRLQLGAAYTQFLQHHLAPGGTLIVSECSLQWPTVQLGDRHIFQHGALGGATPAEYQHGSQRVQAYLARYGSPHARWPSPAADGTRPEAEWGFEPTLLRDIAAVAHQQGYRLRRLVFDEPAQLSPLVADLYHWWYGARGIQSKRLLVESFIVMEPYWALRTGSVPFWMTFNTEPDAAALEHYLDQRPPFDDLFVMLFSHGVDSVGVASMERWRAILARAQKEGAFIGVDEQAYPRDFATYVNYYLDLKHKITPRYPLPKPLTLQQFESFLQQFGARYAVRWVDEARVSERS